MQFRALKFIYDDFTSTYEELLERAHIPSLKIRRMRSMALESYKIITKMPTEHPDP